MKSSISSTGYGRRIVIAPGVSKILLILITSLHVAVLVLLFFIDLDSWQLLGLACLISINLMLYCIAALFNYHVISFQTGKPILLQTGTRSWQEVELVESFQASFLIILKVRTLARTKRRYSLVYAVDSMASKPFRQLRAYLRLYNRYQLKTG